MENTEKIALTQMKIFFKMFKSFESHTGRALEDSCVIILSSCLKIEFFLDSGIKRLDEHAMKACPSVFWGLISHWFLYNLILPFITART